jgi:hypothetical protein
MGDTGIRVDPLTQLVTQLRLAEHQDLHGLDAALHRSYV